MLHTPLKRAILIVVAAAAAWMVAGCAPSIAPGYTIEKQMIEITYSQAAPDRVSVRAAYRIRNTGTQPLDEMRFRLPFKEWAENMRVEWGSEKLAPQSVAGTEVEFSAHLNAPWNRKDRKEFVLAYDLKTVNTSLSLGDGRGAFFFLPSGGWYPYLLPPQGILTQGGATPDKWDLVVSVPQGYRVHASGVQRGPDNSGKRNSTGFSNRFEQRMETDFDPFVVAGPYVEQQAHWGAETVFLWSGRSLPDSRVSEIGDRFGEEAAYFTAQFGLKDATKGQVWMIGCPGELPAGSSQPDQIQTANPGKGRTPIADCLSVPQGVFVPMSFEKFNVPGSFVAPAHGDDSNPMLPVDLQLAVTWFTFAVRESPDGPAFPMSGTPDYMALAFTISKNPSKRGDYIRQLIQRVDSDPEGAKDSLLSTKRIELARIRSELFYLALEDRCGAANVHHALARILHALRGQTWNVGDLRSAMEAECDADLAEFFRQWVLRPGIPDEFRAHYIGTPAAKPAEVIN